MRWEKDELGNIQALLLSSDERNQLIGLELIQQGELWEGFASLLTFLTFADRDRTNIIATSKQILAKMKPETQTYWNEVCGILGDDYTKAWKIQNFEKYIIVFDGYIKKAPRFAHVYIFLGRKLINVHNNYSKGIEYLRKAADFNSDDYTANFEYAFHLELSISNIDKIIKYYTRCMSLNKQSYSLYYNLGNAYFFKKDYDKTIEIFQEAITTFPNKKVESLTMLSEIFKEKGDMSMTRYYLEEIVDINPKNHSVHNNLAFILWSFYKEYKLALEHVKTAIKLYPRHGLYWHTKAEVYWYGLKKKKEALKSLYKGKEMDPSYKEGYSMIKELENI